MFRKTAAACRRRWLFSTAAGIEASAGVRENRHFPHETADFAAFRPPGAAVANGPFNSRFAPVRERPEMSHKPIFLPALVVLAAAGLTPQPLPAGGFRELAPAELAAQEETARRCARPLIQRTSFQLASRSTAVQETREEAPGLVRTAEWNPDESRKWRRTRKGWQRIDVSGAPVIHQLQLPRPERPIHPLPIGALVFLATAAAVSWASDEWDWHRVLKRG
jgi:hypothetical protein